ncbi:MAG TPA: hypothetical protein VFU65_00560 [Actinocrinis sp.]|nr:hypothetical protein [Actinocrinis sp.]
MRSVKRRWKPRSDMRARAAIRAMVNGSARFASIHCYVLACIDPRVDPADILGGRVTDALLADLGWVCHLHEHKTPHADWFDLAVVRHTDCGSGLFADRELRAGFAGKYGYDDGALAALAVLHPAQTARADTSQSCSPRRNSHPRSGSPGTATTLRPVS